MYVCVDRGARGVGGRRDGSGLRATGGETRGGQRARRLVLCGLPLQTAWQDTESGKLVSDC